MTSPYGHPSNMCSIANAKVGARCHLVTGGPVLLIVGVETGEKLDGADKGKPCVTEISVLWFTHDGELRRAIIQWPELLVVVVE